MRAEASRTSRTTRVDDCREASHESQFAIAGYLGHTNRTSEVPVGNSFAMTEPKQHFQMATEIAARAGSHSRRTFDDERCQKRGRQGAERSDAGFSQVLPKLVQMMPVPMNRAFHQSAFTAQILLESRNL